MITIFVCIWMSLEKICQSSALPQHQKSAVGLNPVDVKQMSLALRAHGKPILGHPPSANSRSLIPSDYSLAGWYAGDPSSNGLDPARQAFEDAVESFQGDVSVAECSSWLKSNTTWRDVQDTVEKARAKYEERRGGVRARKWLAKSSEKLMYYSVIMDTLSQHHPEYVSLAWGAIKFLFIAVLNHEELLTEISKTIANIADILPRADLCENLFPTQRMTMAVAQLYAKVMYFVQDAVKWYKKGRLAHSLHAVVSPYATKFKAVVEEVKEASRRVAEEASAAGMAEQRDIHLGQKDLGIEVLELRREVEEQRRLLSLIMANIDSQTLAIRSITDTQLPLLGWVQQQQLAAISSSTPNLTRLPDAIAILDYMRSIKTRRRAQFMLHLPQLSKVRRWHEDPSAFPVLVIRGRGVRTVGRDFSVELLDLIRASGAAAIWSYRHSEVEEDGKTTTMELRLVDVILSLAHQALALNPQVLHDRVNPVASHHFQGQLTEAQCFQLLGRCLNGLPRVYMVLDMALVNAAAEHHQAAARSFVQALIRLLLSRADKGVKVVIVADTGSGGGGGGGGGGSSSSSSVFDVEEHEELEESQIVVGGQGPGARAKRGGVRGITKYSSHRSMTRTTVDWLSEPAVM